MAIAIRRTLSLPILSGPINLSGYPAEETKMKKGLLALAVAGVGGWAMAVTITNTKTKSFSE
ncbi:MAG: hypothetical protein ABSB42_13665 [Tepidisphaeraceae bacterium]|jgi:hypothetical protein